MAHILEDRVLESTTTTGTGALTLAGAVTGFRRFSAVCAVGDTVPYFIEAVDSLGQPTGDYEYGIGTYSGANTLTRTTVLGSSNAGAAVNFPAGSKNAAVSLLAARMQAGSNANGSWRKHPDGTLEQWGVITATSAAGDLSQSFPVAFASVPESITCTSVNGAGTSNNIVAALGSYSASAFTVSAYIASTGVRAAASVFWKASGRY